MPQSIGDWSIRTQMFDLKFPWKIARGEITQKELIFLSFERDGFKFEGECSPNIRYGETIENVLNDWESFNQLWEEEGDFERAYESLEKNCLKSTVQTCWLKQQGSFKRNPIRKIRSSFSMPIMEPGKLEVYLHDHGQGYSIYKIKVKGMETLPLVDRFCELKPGVPFYIDGNEGFENLDDVMLFLEKIKDYPVKFLEQPLAAAKVDEQKELFKLAKLPIIGDESFLADTNPAHMLDLFHGVNVKLMKSPPLRAIEQIQQAKDLGLMTMIGCMVETSLGISQIFDLGLEVDYYDLDGWSFLKGEPYGMIEREGDSYLRK